jgi:hypothetical protein
MNLGVYFYYISREGETCILAVNNLPQYIDGMFPQTITNTAFDYRVVLLKDSTTKLIELKNQSWNYHFMRSFAFDT